MVRQSPRLAAAAAAAAPVQLPAVACRLVLEDPDLLYEILLYRFAVEDAQDADVADVRYLVDGARVSRLWADTMVALRKEIVPLLSMPGIASCLRGWMQFLPPVRLCLSVPHTSRTSAH